MLCLILERTQSTIKYHILKHLSYYDLLEFHYWWSKLLPLEKNGLNFVIRELKDNFKQGFTGKTLQRKYDKYELKFYFLNESEFEFIIEKKLNSSNNLNLMLEGIDRFTDDEIENLFKCLFKEFLFGANFYKYNKIY